MKVLKIVQILVLGLGLMLTFTACGEKGQSTEGTHSHEMHEAESQNAHGDGVEYTSAYVCPMHCEGSGSDKAGECPVCGMQYIAQADHAADGHNHMEKAGDHKH